MLKKQIPGLSMAFGLATVALYGAEVESASRLGLSALTISIIIGMLIGNTCYRYIAIQAACYKQPLRI